MDKFGVINCVQEFCFICKEAIISTEKFSSFSGKSASEIIGSIFSHSLLDDNFFIGKICSTCENKIKIFDEFQTKANQIKDELISLYETRQKFQEIEQLDISFADFNFKSIDLDIIDHESDEPKTEELAEDFKKIIEEKGIKYDYSVFQRVFCEDESPKSKKRKKFFCDECQVEFKNLNNFLIHKADHEKQNYQSSSNDENSISGMRPDERYNCFCGKIFLYKLSYTQHLKIHNQIREYSCESCDFKAYNIAHLKRHVRAKHTKEKPYDCLYCGRKFAEKYNMSSHIRKQHF